MPVARWAYFLFKSPRADTVSMKTIVELMLNIPQTVTDEAAFLRTHAYLEAADSSFCYLLNIDEFIPKGEIAPYEYVAPQVFEMLVNQRKVKFLKDFEEELYDDAVRAGDVVFFPE